MGFKENLKYVRTALGFTQKSLADELEVSRPTVTQWETGWNEPRMGTIKKIAAKLNIPVAVLIADTLPDLDQLPPMNETETKLVSMFRALDDIGRAKVMGYMEGLTSSGEYSGGECSPSFRLGRSDPAPLPGSRGV